MLEVLESTGITALLVASLFGGLGWVFRNWIFTKITGSVEHDFSKKLEEFKVDLTAQTSRELAAHGAGVSAQIIGAEKRIEAIDKLWQIVCKIRNRKYKPFSLLCYLTEDEYLERIASEENGPQLRNGDIETSHYFDLINELNPEALRPFITPRMWQLFFIYRAFNGRLIFLEEKCAEGESEYFWTRDNGVTQILGHVLTEEQFKKILDGPFKDPTRINDALEGAILADAHAVINGEEFGKESLRLSKSLQDISKSIYSVPR